MGNLRKIRKAVQNLHPQTQSQPDGRVERIDLDRSELEAILEHTKTTALSEEEYAKLYAAMETLIFLTAELEKKRVSVERLKQLLFGVTTETTQKVMEKILDQAGKAKASEKDTAGNQGSADPDQAPSPEPAKGHGRNGAGAYTGAEVVRIPHESLKAGDPCPNCRKGTVYQSVEPAHLVRIRGQAPLGATVYELQKLRCNLCGKIFTAQAPPEVGPDKYDAASASMIALLKYGSGLPFNRLEGLQGSLGIPLPAATQWEIVAGRAGGSEPVFREMIRQAAQGQVVHHDDTKMQVLAGVPFGLGSAGPQIEAGQAEEAERRGVFTTGILSIVGSHRIALFFTGHRHAGENLMALLEQRASQLDRPIQMCDALSRNMPEALQTILANCLTHGRRKFVDVAMHFPDECLYVLEIFKAVYRNEAMAKSRQMPPEERLRFHQAESGPKMAQLKAWMTAQFEQRQVEPNSGLGEAISYMLKHWDALTLFLRQPAAPLDNNVCERALKKAILHRKNSYFYKTLKGAHVGDLYMSLIHTCELNGVNPFDYLTALNRHADALASSPADWMPWTYQDMLAKQAAIDRDS
jgi:transposase